MPESRERIGPFWDVVEGRVPMPPIAALLGWRLEEIDPEAGSIVVSYDAKPEFANPMGNVQGGVIAAMLDDTMGPALIATLPHGRVAPTLEMKVSFLEPASIGGRLFGHGRVLKVGGTIAFLEGDVRDEKGRVLARATATARLAPVDSASHEQHGDVPDADQPVQPPVERRREPTPGPKRQHQKAAERAARTRTTDRGGPPGVSGRSDCGPTRHPAARSRHDALGVIRGSLWRVLRVRVS